MRNQCRMENAAEEMRERLQIKKWLDHLVDKYGHAKTVAKMAGISGSTITRFMKDWETWPIIKKTTIAKIEAATGESFLEFTQGAAPVNDFEKRALACLRGVKPDDQAAVLATLRAFARTSE